MAELVHRTVHGRTTDRFAQRSYSKRNRRCRPPVTHRDKLKLCHNPGACGLNWLKNKTDDDHDNTVEPRSNAVANHDASDLKRSIKQRNCHSEENNTFIMASDTTVNNDFVLNQNEHSFRPKCNIRLPNKLNDFVCMSVQKLAADVMENLDCGVCGQKYQSR